MNLILFSDSTNCHPASGVEENVQPLVFVPDHNLHLHHHTDLVSVGLCANVRDGLVDFILSAVVRSDFCILLTAVDSIRLLVWNLDAEFFLDGHHHLDGIQAVQSKVILEV